MSLRALLGAVLLLLLAACADPPGVSKPLPTDPAEVTASTNAHKRLAADLRAEPGVLGTYLTQTNNPRRLVVVVQDEATRDRISNGRPRRYDGVKLRFEIAPQGFRADSDAPIAAVPVEAVPEGWWDRFIYWLKHYGRRLKGAVTSGASPSPDASASPNPSPEASLAPT